METFSKDTDECEAALEEMNSQHLRNDSGKAAVSTPHRMPGITSSRLCKSLNRRFAKQRILLASPARPWGVLGARGSSLTKAVVCVYFPGLVLSLERGQDQEKQGPCTQYLNPAIWNQNPFGSVNSSRTR